MYHTRHMGIFTIPDAFQVNIIGVGGIGAVAGLTLAKMGVKTLNVYDFDTVDQENIATQLYKPSDVGNQKVNAFADIVTDFSDETWVSVYDGPVPDAFNVSVSDLTIMAVDGIEVRKKVYFSLWQDKFPNWILDTRMSAGEYQHFLIDANDDEVVEGYEGLLEQINDKNVPDVVCTEKATFYTAMMAAGHIGKVVKDIVTNSAVSHRLVHNIHSNYLATFQVR